MVWVLSGCRPHGQGCMHCVKYVPFTAEQDFCKKFDNIVALKTG